MHTLAVQPVDRPNPRHAQWYAIWTRGHCEQSVTDQLTALGFGMFLPRAMSWRGRGAARRRQLQPLFPGYVFVEHEMDHESQVAILGTRGVVRILGDRWDRLTPIPHEEVEAIRRVLDTGAPVSGRVDPEAGARVRITAGPLCPLEGRFLHARRRKGLFVVSVTLLRRAVAIEVDETLVEVL